MGGGCPPDARSVISDCARTVSKWPGGPRTTAVTNSCRLRPSLPGTVKSDHTLCFLGKASHRTMTEEAPKLIYGCIEQALAVQERPHVLGR